MWGTKKLHSFISYIAQNIQFHPTVSQSNEFTTTPKNMQRAHITPCVVVRQLIKRIRASLISHFGVSAIFCVCWCAIQTIFYSFELPVAPSQHTHTHCWEKERVSAVCIIIMNWWYCYALRHCYVTRLLDWLTDWCVQSPTRHSSAKSSYRAKVWQHHNDKASTRTQLSVYARIYWRVAREEWNSQRVSTEQCAVHSDDGFCFVSHGKPSLCMRLWGARIR